MKTSLEMLASSMVLGECLSNLHMNFGGFELVDHWTQGEFHHDLVIRTSSTELPPVMVISTNCNGGIKDILGMPAVPDRGGLWRWRCPDNPDFVGPEPQVEVQVTTVHYFEPCEILADDTRSELKPSCRVRQPGGGWQLI